MTLLLASFGAIAQNEPPEIELKTIPEYHVNLSYGWNTSEGIQHVELGLNKDLFNFKDDKIRIGFGVRMGVQDNAKRSYTTAHPTIKDNAADIDSIYLDKAVSVALNFYLNAEYYLTDKISVGGNMDLLGISMGPDYDAGYMPGTTSIQKGWVAENKVNAFATRANAFSFGNSKGCLNSQLYVRAEPFRKVSFRFGLAYLFQEFSTDRSFGAYSAYRFENNKMALFAGVTFNRFDEK